MRIRQIRPEFFTDPVTGHLEPSVQVTYIGLWCIADDGGWLDWDVPQIGAVLYPYKSVRARETSVLRAGVALVGVGRLVVMDCGCARIPTLAVHQKIGGNKSFTARDKHERHEVQTRMDLYARNVTVGNGSNGTHDADAARRSGGAATMREAMLAAGLKPEIAGKAS
jgi:hypothetical protein